MRRIVERFWRECDIYIQKRWRKTVIGSVINGKVLMFHHVSDKELPDVIPSCKCTTQQFKDVLESNIAQGYKFVSISDMMQIIKDNSSQKFAVITFDDVPDDFYYNAYPILKENKISFALFITTNFIGREGFLSKEHLKSLSQDKLCTIGSHTVSHPMLRRVSNIKQELAESKTELENIIGCSVDYMAYPFGKKSSISTKVTKVAQKVGYKCAFGTIDAPITDYTSKKLFYLPRVVEKQL